MGLKLTFTHTLKIPSWSNVWLSNFVRPQSCEIFQISFCVKQTYFMKLVSPDNVMTVLWGHNTVVFAIQVSLKSQEEGKKIPEIIKVRFRQIITVNSLKNFWVIYLLSGIIVFVLFFLFFLKKTLWPLFLDGVHLPRGYKATTRKQFTFYH